MKRNEVKKSNLLNKKIIKIYWYLDCEFECVLGVCSNLTVHVPPKIQINDVMVCADGFPTTPAPTPTEPTEVTTKTGLYIQIHVCVYKY